MAAHRCVCPGCGCQHRVEASAVPGGVVSALGLSLVPSRPQIGLAVLALGILFHRELDQFFRYRCPACGTALQILAEVV